LPSAAEDGAVEDNRVLQVGPGRDVRTIAAASRLARDGDTVVVDAGNYTADVAVWTQQQLHLRTAGGRVRLLAAGASAEGKGTWVVRGEMTVEGFDFHGARVRDHNGAGIRFERGRLTVRDCIFSHNQVGLQTNNDPHSELTVEYCEFAHNLRPDGHNHQLYAGNIGRLTVRGCYFHHGFVGHLLKSRAAFNHIYCNRITDEGGRASYELEFPNGGVAIVIGNLIAQSALTENAHLVSYGAEGYRWEANELYLAHNTLVDWRTRGGIFLRVSPGAGRVMAINNVLHGVGRMGNAGTRDFRNNLRARRDDFVDAADHDFRLQPKSTLRGRTLAVGMANGLPLSPSHEYVHPSGLRQLNGPASNPGAFQEVG
jgi:hypothetical protein